MRCLVRNKRSFYYANYDKKEPVIDEYGNQTGEFKVTYTFPIPYKANISPAKGETINEYFGEAEDYDRVIVLENNVNISEQSILWIDREPTQAHNYIIKKVAKSLNSTILAVKKVDVSK